MPTFYYGGLMPTVQMRQEKQVWQVAAYTIWE